MDFHSERSESYSHLTEYHDYRVLSWMRNLEYSPLSEYQLNALTHSLRESGVVDPLVCGVGQYSQRCRLDTGNHRIWIAPQLGIFELPTVVAVHNYCAISNANGDHSSGCADVLRLAKQYYPGRDTVRYRRFSEVFDLPTLYSRYAPDKPLVEQYI